MQKINDKVKIMILDQKSSGSKPDRTTKEYFNKAQKPVSHMIYRLLCFMLYQFISNNFKQNVSNSVSKFLFYF
jgi:hypothetical protein